MTRFLITHPGRQHSHQLALALASSHQLAGYWSGVPSVPQHRRLVPPWLWRRFVRYPLTELPAATPRWFFWMPALRKVGSRLPAGSWWDFLLCRAFDRRLARLLGGVDAAGVVSCEISALRTFAVARRRGWTTVLDAPSLHHRAQDEALQRSGSTPLRRAVARVKDREIALADHVLTTSGVARDSYLAAGCPAERVHALPLGVDLELFHPGGSSPPDSRVVFVFVGHTSRSKGFDTLIEACEGVADRGPFELRIIGSRGDCHDLLASRPQLPLTTLGQLAPAALAGELRSSHCLILPSRLESFGLVVPEALACGAPVLVSDRVGAKSLVTPAVDGWIVPAGDAAALAARMVWCLEHPGELLAMRPACRAAAAAAGWGSYRKAAVELFTTFPFPTVRAPGLPSGLDRRSAEAP